MKHTSERGNDYPKQIEDLGTGSFYFNFNIRKKEEEEGYIYNQIRFEYPIDNEIIKKTLIDYGYKEFISEIK